MNFMAIFRLWFSFANFQDFRIFLHDVHEDVVDVVPQLKVDFLLVLKLNTDLKKEKKKG